VAPRLAHRRAIEGQHVAAVEGDLAGRGLDEARMQRPVVVLPLPDSPTSPKVSPCSTENETRSTARASVTRPKRP
jgi:hypothetical protein